MHGRQDGDLAGTDAGDGGMAIYRDEVAQLCDAVPGLLAAKPPFEAPRDRTRLFLDYGTALSDDRGPRIVRFGERPTVLVQMARIRREV